jgi:putative Mg2+ transporter-C (MgtC) family protein
VLTALTAQTAIDLAVAALLGAGIGFQRQYTQKPAGIRTHALVALGSCAFASYSVLTGDSRIAAGVVTGVGFLGAGAIVRHGMSPRGLTTAASIWTASAIGMGVGLGHLEALPVIAVLAVLTIALLTVSDDVVLRMLPRRTTLAIRVDVDLDRVTFATVHDELCRLVTRARYNQELSIERYQETRRASVGFIIELDVRKELTPVFDALSCVDGVLRVTAVDEPASTTT